MGKLILIVDKLNLIHERVSNLEHNKSKLDGQKEELIERCRTQQEKVEELKLALSSVDTTVQSNEQSLGEKKNDLESIEKSMDEAKVKIKEHEEKTLGLTSSQISIRNDLTDVMKEDQGAMARKRRYNIENEKVTSEEKEVNQKLETVKTQINDVQNMINTLVADKANRSQSMEESKTRLSQLGDQIKTLERKSLSLKSQKEFIEKNAYAISRYTLILSSKVDCLRRCFRWITIQAFLVKLKKCIQLTPKSTRA